MEAAADLMPEGSEERGDLPEAEHLWNFFELLLMFFGLFFRPLERLHDLTWMVTRCPCKPTRCV